MRRRDFTAVLAAFSLSPPITGLMTSGAAAQQKQSRYRIAVLIGQSRETPQFAAYLDELKLFGLTDTTDFEIDPRGFTTRDRFAEVAAALVAARPDAIVCSGYPAIRA